MPNNIPVEDYLLEQLNAMPVELSTKAFQEGLNDNTDLLLAAVTPIGLMCEFELDEEELQAIKNGKTKFLIHFMTQEGVSPFMLIFERDTLDGTQKENNAQSRLSESDGPEEN